MPSKHTGIAVIESKWWEKSNVSIRSLFELIADLYADNPHSYHYEMANSEAALKEAILRVSSYKECRYLCLAMHGNEKGLELLNGEHLSRTELRNALDRVQAKHGAKISGLHLASCMFGTPQIADHIFQNQTNLVWMAGYTEKIDWIESSALDLLFFNQLISKSGETEVKKVQRVAKRLLANATGLVRKLGFGIYVRKQKTGGSKNLLAAAYE